MLLIKKTEYERPRLLLLVGVGHRRGWGHWRGRGHLLLLLLRLLLPLLGTPVGPRLQLLL